MLMPWRNPKFAPFTRIGVVSQIPSQSGVFGLLAGDRCVLVAQSWNLKARLLDLINTLSPGTEFTVVYELCPEDQADARRDELHEQLISGSELNGGEATTHATGISFWATSDTAGDGPEA